MIKAIAEITNNEHEAFNAERPRVQAVNNPFAWRAAQNHKKQLEHFSQYDSRFCRSHDITWVEWLAERDNGGY